MEERKKCFIMTRPVFDVYSISIQPGETKGCSNPFSDGKLCRIYGSVKVRDEYGSVYHLYNKKEDDPDIIKLGGNISLKGFPVISSKTLTVSIYLYDMTHQAEISNGSFVLDYSCQFRYDEFQTSVVKGQYGFVRVHHVTFLHAAVADVEQVSIEKEDGSGNLSGRVVAYLVQAGGNKYASIVLFDNAQKEEECKSAVAKFNTPIQLYRSCVAVPVFCKLRIEIDFCDENGSRITKTFDRHVDIRGLCEESAIDQNLVFIVEISWPFCQEKFPRKRGVTDQVTGKEIFTQDLKAFNIMSQLPSEPQKRITCFGSRFAKYSVITYVEVFSVLICFDDDVLDIDGTITLKGSSGESLHIFRGSDKLSPKRKTLALQCPPSLFKIKDECFDMAVSLKDGKGRVVGEGKQLCIDKAVDLHFDRHLCAVFKGDIAYTAVHYSILRRCVQARVVVSFIKKDTQIPETEVGVYGSITAEYGSYEYSTPYDQQNYKYKLFSRSEDDCTRCDLGSRLELSKSLLPVPFQETLILDVDLKVGQGLNQKFGPLKQVVKFKHCQGNIVAIKKGNYVFVVLVEWSNDEDPNPFTSPNISDMRSLRRMMPNIHLKV